MQMLSLHAKLSTLAISWSVGVVVQEAIFYILNCEGSNMKTNKLASSIKSNFH